MDVRHGLGILLHELAALGCDQARPTYHIMRYPACCNLRERDDLPFLLV
jgi:hypothetical protein